MEPVDAAPSTSRLLLAARVARLLVVLLVAGAAGLAVNRWVSEDAAVLPDHSLPGLLAGLALLVEALLRLFALVLGARSAPVGVAPRLAYALFSILLIGALGAGYVALATASPEPEFLGVTLTPLAPDISLADAFSSSLGISPPLGEFGAMSLAQASGSAHRVLAGGAIAALAGYLIALLVDITRPADDAAVFALPARHGAGVPEAEAFGSRLRFIGWIIFWVQLLISIASGLMFQLAQPGRKNMPDNPWYLEPIGWGGVALTVMLGSLALAYVYTRLAGRIIAKPERYLDPRRLLSQWFLALGIALGFVGVFTSFTGVAMSVWMLIGKIVSQPPGIAITDPTNFIRMLDMLILIANIALLMGHVLGAGATQWLRINASRARVDMLHALMAPAPPQKSDEA